MQIDSMMEIFDTVTLTPACPAHPMGKLFCYQPSAQPEALHYHNFLELGYCEYGDGVFIVDGDILPFNGRCASIIYEGQKHIAQSITPQDSLWHFLYVDLEKLFDGSDNFSLNVPKSFYYRDFDFKNLLTYEENPEIYDLIRLIMAETAENRPDVLMSLRGLVFSLLIKHGRTMRRKAGAGKDKFLRHLEDISPVMDYINLHYMEDITMETLEGLSNASRASVQRKFQAVTGRSPIQYLHELRIKRASVMLQAGKKTVMQISLEVGYNSLSSFNRMFLRTMGMSPSAWRKQFAPGQVQGALAG